MTYEQYLLVKLAEEAAEVSQIALKAAQFGLDDAHPFGGLNKAGRIAEELDDLLAIVDILNSDYGLAFTPSQMRRARKKFKVDEWAAHAAKKGRLDW